MNDLHENGDAADRIPVFFRRSPRASGRWRCSAARTASVDVVFQDIEPL
jgi:hypothetical protein